MLSMAGHRELEKILRERAVRVQVTANSNEAVKHLHADQIGFLLLDAERGLDPAVLLAAGAAGARVIVMSRADSAALRMAAFEAGAASFVVAPGGYRALADAIAPLESEPDWPKPRILAYARGEAATAELVELLEPAAAEVFASMNPLLACELLSTQRPDLIVLDVSNEIRICALQQSLRADPLAQTVPIILLADNYVEDFSRLLGRYDHLLVVPITPAHLHWQIDRVFRERIGEQAHRVVGPGSAIAGAVVALELAAAIPTQTAREPHVEALASSQPAETAPLPAPDALVAPEDLAALKQEVLNAIQYSQMSLHYQPIVSLRGDGIERYEALLRLTGSARQALKPAEVFSVLKGHRSALLLDRFVLSEALAMLRARVAERLLFVNLSLDALSDMSFLEWLAERLAAAQIPPAQLVLDVGLEQVKQAPEQVRQGVRRLRNLGCQISLQNALLTVDEVNIAQTLGMRFIKVDLNRSLHELLAPAAQNALKAAAREATARQIELIACRVENHKVLPLLWASGIELVQGYITQAPGLEMSFDFAQGL